MRTHTRARARAHILTHTHTHTHTHSLTHSLTHTQREENRPTDRQTGLSFSEHQRIDQARASFQLTGISTSFREIKVNRFQERYLIICHKRELLPNCTITHQHTLAYLGMHTNTHACASAHTQTRKRFNFWSPSKSWIRKAALLLYFL